MACSPSGQGEQHSQGERHTSSGMLQLRAAPAPGGVKVPALALPSGPTMSVRLDTRGTTGMLLLCSSADLRHLASWHTMYSSVLLVPGLITSCQNAGHAVVLCNCKPIALQLGSC